MSKFKDFLAWIDKKKGRMKKAVISIILFLVVIGGIILGVVFLLTFGYDKETGWNKEPAKVDVNINVKKKGIE